jgi:hypothetical protein
MCVRVCVCVYTNPSSPHTHTYTYTHTHTHTHTEQHFNEYVEQLQRLAQDPNSGLFCVNLGHQGSMLSYPNGNDARHHPDVVVLAAAAEKAGVDLRIVVLSRWPLLYLYASIKPLYYCLY